MKKIIIFGGAFNPPLYSHFSLAEQIINELEEVYKIIFVPVNSSYKKNEIVIANNHRYNMLKLVCDKNENFEVSDVELKEERQLNTIETLNIFSKIYQGFEIIFMTGTDNLKEFHTWVGAEDILKNYRVLVLERDNDCMEEIISSNEFLNRNRASFIKIKDNIRTNLSSTYIRNKIRNGKSIKYLIPDEIYEYIKTNKLYEVM